MGLREEDSIVAVGASVCCAGRDRERDDAMPLLEESDDSDSEMPPLEVEGGTTVQGVVDPDVVGVVDDDDEMPALEHDSD
jgi:hypothetical protein